MLVLKSVDGRYFRISPEQAEPFAISSERARELSGQQPDREEVRPYWWTWPGRYHTFHNGWWNW